MCFPWMRGILSNWAQFVIDLFRQVGFFQISLDKHLLWARTITDGFESWSFQLWYRARVNRFSLIFTEHLEARVDVVDTNYETYSIVEVFLKNSTREFPERLPNIQANRHLVSSENIAVEDTGSAMAVKEVKTSLRRKKSDKDFDVTLFQMPRKIIWQSSRIDRYPPRKTRKASMNDSGKFSLTVRESVTLRRSTMLTARSIGKLNKFCKHWHSTSSCCTLTKLSFVPNVKGIRW